MTSDEQDYGHILDTIAFKSMRPQQIAEKVADHIEGMSSWSWPRDQKRRIQQRIDRLAEKYGNLGVSRRKMAGMVVKILRRRSNRRAASRRAQVPDVDQDA